MSSARVCLECGRQSPPHSVLCIHCGAGPDGRPTLGGIPAAPDDAADLAEQVRTLAEQIRALVGRVTELEAAAESRSASVRSAEVAGEAPEHPPVSTPAIVDSAPVVTPEPVEYSAAERERSTAEQIAELEAAVRRVSPSAPIAGSEFTAAFPSEPLSPTPREQDPGAAPRGPTEGTQLGWEGVLGRNWFAIIGVVSLAIGIGFFLKLAFDNRWIGPTGQVVLGIVVGLVMIAAAEYTARRAPPWSRAAAGGGIAILYLAIYASFGFYHLIPVIPALVLLALSVAVGWVLSIRQSSRVVAFIALFGAFLTPVLLGGDIGGRLYVGLGYLLIIDAGIVAVASVRRWRWYTLIGMVASYALFAAWTGRIAEQETIFAQLGLSGVFLIFFGAATLYNVLWRRSPNHFDMTLITVNAFAFYGLTFGVMWERYAAWFGLITFLMAVFHGLAAYAALARRGVSPVVPLQLTGAAVVFLTVAAALELSGEWVSVAWAAEGAVLVWLGIVTASLPNRLMGLAVLAAAVFRILIVETGSADAGGFVPVLNDRFLAFAFGIGALLTAGWLYSRKSGDVEELEAREAPRALVGSSCLLAMWIISAEVISYFDRQALEAVGGDAVERATNAMLSTLTVAWVIYGSVLMALARWRPARFLAMGALAVIGAAAAKLLLADPLMIGIPRGAHSIVLNYYFLSFVFVVAAIATAAYLERRWAAFSGPDDLPIFEGLVIAANAVVVWVFTAEVVRFFGNRELVNATSYESAMHMTLTVMWAVYAAFVISVGVLRGSQALRVGGMALLALPVAKLFVFDVFLLDRGYRVGAFIILGALLLLMGLAYQRYRSTVKGFFLGDRSAPR